MLKKIALTFCIIMGLTCPIYAEEGDLPSITIAGVKINKGEQKYIKIPLPPLFDNTEMFMPVHVIAGKKNGPVLFISASIHGDEIIGGEIIRWLLEREELKDINGILITAPIVNPYAYNNNIRYSPDRRDLNRNFPGSGDGSLTEIVADTFNNEIVMKSNYGIDIHSGPIHKNNYPQIRYDFTDVKASALAEAFKAPVTLNSPAIQGSLRNTSHKFNVTTILFEGGEGLRYDDEVIKTCLNGILNVMKHLKMINGTLIETKKTFIANSNIWVRAPASGSFRSYKLIGQTVKKGDILGLISDPLQQNKNKVKASYTGMIIGTTTIPLVHTGDALFNIAIGE